MPRYPLPPSTQAAFNAAAQRLFKAIAASDARASAGNPAAPFLEPALCAVDADLADAVRRRDRDACLTAIRNGADVNAGAGTPLRLAAENKDYALMKELVIRGAEVSAAIAGLKDGKKTLRVPTVNRNDPEIRRALETLLATLGPGAARTGHLDVKILMDEIDRQRGGEGPLGAVVSQRIAQVNGTIKTLEEWRDRFVKDIAPIEILRQQQQILDQLAELKREIAPPPLDKPKLQAPPPAPPR